jgi:IclR family transcriptional regulator, acetate operon repressor
MSMVGRAFSILDAFTDESVGLRLSTISRRTGLPLPTTLRLVRELVSWGGLERQADGSYRLGARLWALGVRAPCIRQLVETGRPHLRRLHATTGLAVQLVVMDGREGLVVDALGAGAGTRGSRVPLHTTAAGKVLLAHAADSLRYGVLGDLARVTPYSITAPGLLERQLATIRAGSLALAKEEQTLGEIEIAAPVGTAGTRGTAELAAPTGPAAPAAPALAAPALAAPALAALTALTSLAASAAVAPALTALALTALASAWATSPDRRPPSR